MTYQWPWMRLTDTIERTEKDLECRISRGSVQKNIKIKSVLKQNFSKFSLRLCRDHSRANPEKTRSEESKGALASKFHVPNSI